jgi:hypothetical protein
MQNGFERLGLLPDADARDIRRAYARELKKIDQVHDGAGFQALREAYEEALAWRQWQADGKFAGTDRNTDAVAVFPQTPLPVLQEDPEQLADAVMDDFRATLAILGANHSGASDALWQDALRRALADERLIGIEARHGFEWRVAHLLVDGWRPGHEALLVAAAAIFDWSRTAHLDGLGHAGAILDWALIEQAMFDNQAIVDKQAQRRVIRLLRQEALPKDVHMAQDIAFFTRLHMRFPNWLAIVAPAGRIAYWHARAPAPGMPMDVAPEDTAWGPRILIACLGLLALYHIQGTDMMKLSPVLAQQDAQEQLQYRSAGAPPSRARIDDIIARIGYPLDGEAPDQPRAATFDVFLDADGRVIAATLAATSGDPGLDAAIRTAILRSEPFPSQTSRAFPLTFAYTQPAHDKQL